MLRLRSNVAMTTELPCAGDRAQLVDALDGVDGLFDDLGDLGLHLLGRRAGQRRAHGDGRQVDGRKRSTPSRK